MADLIYPKYKEAVLDGDPNIDVDDGTVMAVLIDTAAYTYNAAHDFLDDVPSGARVGTPQVLANTTVVGGLFDADNVVFPAVTGPTCGAILVYISTGVEATSRLFLLRDTATGLPVTPNGGDITIAWNAAGIAQL